MEKILNFDQLGLSPQTLEAIKRKGFEEPTPIQAKIIPFFLKGDLDVIGQAQTGTGKTAAFGLPLIECLKEKSSSVQVLVLCPTRELAIQVAEEINSLKGKKRLQVVAIYGGQSIDQQLRRLSRGVDIVVGTPGRVIDHIKRKSLRLDQISHMVLDEADEMLNMGFIEDIEEIIKTTNENKRMLLFSATMPERIVRLAKKYMKTYEVIRVKAKQLTADSTEQIYFEVSSSDKLEALCRIIDIETDFYGLVFCRTKVGVDELAQKLSDRGYEAEALHGDVSQFQRERILRKFRNRKINILVATDVAARGIDINDLTHVINFSLPQDPQSYIHRIGRTGRAGKEGTAITFITPAEYRSLMFIKKIAKTDIRREKIPQVKDIINSKKKKIQKDIEAIIEKGNFSEYCDFANDLCLENDPQTVLAALLKKSYRNELDVSSYNQIREVSVDKKGKTRLFIALGKMDKMAPKKLLNFINQKTQIDVSKIRDLQIFEKFSFITVPFTEAEIILRTFKKENKRRPMVTKAKKKK